MKKNLEQKVSEILERNSCVEADKAWETSNTRKALITISTYIIVVIFLVLINAPNPFVNALVPTIGFVLSTLTLPFIKKFWTEKFYKK